MSGTPAERALCCGPTCGQGKHCAAATYGRGIASRAWLAGFAVLPREMPADMPELVIDVQDMSSAGLWRAVVAAMEERDA